MRSVASLFTSQGHEVGANSDSSFCRLNLMQSFAACDGCAWLCVDVSASDCICQGVEVCLPELSVHREHAAGACPM